MICNLFSFKKIILTTIPLDPYSISCDDKLMVKQNLGYACINMHLSEVPKSKRVTTNRSMIKRTFQEKGERYASELALQNVLDLEKIVAWNEAHGFKFFRISSELFPWASEYEISSLPHFSEIRASLQRTGKLAAKYGQRLTFHPGPYNKLTSPKEHVIKNTIRDLEIHSEIFDLMEVSVTPYNKINIHVGAHYNDKEMALSNFRKNFMKLSENCQARLTVENDDKASLYSTKELYENIYEHIGIPVVFDYHHHRFCDGGQSEEEALKLAVSTWGSIIPVVHYSESRCAEQQIKCIPQAHSDYVYQYIDQYNCNVDIMVEAKKKELAVIRYKELHCQDDENQPSQPS